MTYPTTNDESEGIGESRKVVKEGFEGVEYSVSG